jgi:hypothetical protein
MIIVNMPFQHHLGFFIQMRLGVTFPFQFHGIHAYFHVNQLFFIEVSTLKIGWIEPFHATNSA